MFNRIRKKSWLYKTYDCRILNRKFNLFTKILISKGNFVNSKSTFVFMHHIYMLFFPPNISLPILQLKPAPPITTANRKRKGCLFWSDSMDPLLNIWFLYKYVLFLYIYLVFTLRLIEHLSTSTHGFTAEIY